MKIILILFVFIPFVLFSQVEEGIKFEDSLNWAQIQYKAKAENKYIFIDCYTSICEPCSKMDKNIYNSGKVGQIINEKFIALKLQMDTSINDDEFTKSRYEIASSINKENKVKTFPTFLFFTPDGKIVHRDDRYVSVDEFIRIAESALDSQKQYYTLLSNYKEGNVDYNLVPSMAYLSQQFKEDELAFELVNYYYNSYLSKKKLELYKRKDIEFLVDFIQSTKDRSFYIFNNHSNVVDSIMQKSGYSQKITDYIIAKSEITPLINKAIKDDRKINWDILTINLTVKYGLKTASRNVLTAKVKWHKRRKEWRQFTKTLIKRVERYGVYGPVLDVDFNLNNHAWDIFLHSTEKSELEKALLWSDSAIKINNDQNKPNWMDTKANLLYKLGRKDEALIIEIEAARMDEKNTNIQENLAKMRKGEPTW